MSIFNLPYFRGYVTISRNIIYLSTALIDLTAHHIFLDTFPSYFSLFAFVCSFHMIIFNIYHLMKLFCKIKSFK